LRLVESGDFLAMWGSGPDDIYAVGRGGTVLHKRGGGDWSPEVLPLVTPTWATDPTNVEWKDLLGVWGSGSQDVYVVGDAGIYHSDGTGHWTQQYSAPRPGALKAIWGEGATSIFVVGAGELILHSVGDGRWDTQAGAGALPPALPPDLYAVWGTAGQVYAAGDGGRLDVRASDGTWRSEDLGVSEPFYGLWGTGPSDIYVVGGHCTIVHYNGRAWEQQFSVTRPQSCSSAWGSAPNDLYVGGDDLLLHSTGAGAWESLKISLGTLISSLWGSSDSVYAAGTGLFAVQR
jgi:hypothetical protein